MRISAPKISAIQNDIRRKHWELMGKMLDEQAQMNDLYDAVPRNDAQLSTSYRKISDLRQHRFELLLSAQRQIDAVLSKSQRAN